MGRAFALESFDTDDPWEVASPVEPPAFEIEEPPDSSEEDRLAAYETGYKAGWDDAVKAQNGEVTQIGAELARNLEDLGFTLHEAREHVLRALAPLMSELVDRLLPQLLRESVAPLVLETVLPMAEDATDMNMEIVTAPEHRSSIENLLAQQSTREVRVIEEDTLSEGQAFIRLGATEKEIDLGTLYEQIGTALSSVLDPQEEVKAYG